MVRPGLAVLILSFAKVPKSAQRTANEKERVRQVAGFQDAGGAVPACLRRRRYKKNYSKLSKHGPCGVRSAEDPERAPHSARRKSSLKAPRTPWAAARPHLRLRTTADGRTDADVLARKNHCTERTAHLSRLRRDFYTAACCFTLAVSVCLSACLPDPFRARTCPPSSRRARSVWAVVTRVLGSSGVERFLPAAQPATGLQAAFLHHHHQLSCQFLRYYYSIQEII